MIIGMLRFFVAFFLIFICVPTITIDDGGSASASVGSAAKKAGKAAASAAKKAGKAAAAAAKKAAKAASAAAKKAAAATKKAASKAAAATKKAAAKAAKATKAAAAKAAKAAKAADKKAAKVAKVAAKNSQNIITGVKMAQEVQKGNYKGAARVAAVDNGYGVAFDAGDAAVGAAQDGNWEKAGQNTLKATAHGSGNGATYDQVEDIVEANNPSDNSALAAEPDASDDEGAASEPVEAAVENDDDDE